MATSPSISIAILGSGGAGALTTGDMLLETASAAGWHGLYTRTLGPQIRGGEAAGLLRLAVHPVECLPDQFDLLVGIDWLNAHRFGAEIKVGPQTLVISDPRGGDLPPMVTESGARVVEVPMKDMAKAIPNGRPNMIALGIASRLLGFGSAEQVSAAITRRLAEKGAAAIEASLAGIKAGFGAAEGIAFGTQLAPAGANAARRWLLSGNEATGLGAIRGGVRFAAAYPITPATEVLEWLAPNLAKVGGHAAASRRRARRHQHDHRRILWRHAFTDGDVGTRAFADGRSAGSCHRRGNTDRGRGRDARRALDGDSDEIRAGRPQYRRLWHARRRAASRAGAAIGRRLCLHRAMGDLSRGNAASSGHHSFRPVHGTIPCRDCTARRPCVHRRADHRHRNQPEPTSATLWRPTACRRWRFRERAAVNIPPTVSPIPSAAPRPAEPPTIWPSSTSGATSSTNSTSATIGQASKAPAILAIITWGSLTGAAREAAGRAAADGIDVRIVAPRLLAPVQPERLAAALAGVKRIMVVEQTHGGQFHKYLRAHYDLPAPVRAFNRPGPLPIGAGEIHRAITEWR